MPPASPPDRYLPVSEAPDALFVHVGDRYLPTMLTQGPWSPRHQFGGAPAALVAHVVERVPSLVPMQVARLTVDLLRPVPIEPITVEWEVTREGKRIQAVAVMLTAAGEVVVRASALRMRVADLSHLGLPAGPAFAGPPAVPVRPYQGPSRPVDVPGMAGALDYAHEHEGMLFQEPTWLRLRVPAVAGEPASPLERMAYVADSVSGLGHVRDAPVTGINADITLSVVRPAEGEWLRIDGGGWIGPAGIGVAQATMSDERGVVATVALSRLVDELTGEAGSAADQ